MNPFRCPWPEAKEIAALRGIPLASFLELPMLEEFTSIDVGHPGQTKAHALVEKEGAIFYVLDYCCWGVRRVEQVLL